MKAKAKECTHEKLQKELEKASEKAKRMQEENKRLKRKNKRLEEKVDKLEKYKESTKSIKDHIKNRQNGVVSQRVARHSYRDVQMLTCMLLYVYAGCSFRGVTKVLEVFDFVYKDMWPRIPAYTTIKGWIEKAGLSLLKRSKDNLPDAYSVIMDESITMGGQKLLLALSVPAQAPDRPIKHSDTMVVGLTASKSNKGEDIKNHLQKLPNDKNNVLAYGVSDNGTNLCKGFRESGIDHHRDISHTFSTFLERTYANEEAFQDLTKKIANARNWSITDMAAVMPPKQRAIARFMNMFDWIEWAEKMNANDFNLDFNLDKKQKYFCSFLRKHASLVDELVEVAGCLKQILKVIKCKGLSFSSAEECRKIAKAGLLTRGDKRMHEVGVMVLEYFDRECSLLKDAKDAHVISSDIIESTFGYFKEHRAKNRRSGLTTQVLLLPLYTRMTQLNDAKSIDVRDMMVTTTVGAVTQWSKDTLPPSMQQQKNAMFRNPLSLTN